MCDMYWKMRNDVANILIFFGIETIWKCLPLELFLNGYPALVNAHNFESVFFKLAIANGCVSLESLVTIEPWL